MPSISMFYGIVIYMYVEEGEKHHLPHVHARYAGEDASFDLENGDKLAGKFPPKQTSFVKTWILLHQEELRANWSLLSAGDTVYKIDPLR